MVSVNSLISTLIFWLLAFPAYSMDAVRCGGHLRSLDYAMVQSQLPFGDLFSAKDLQTTPFLRFLTFGTLYSRIVPKLFESYKEFAMNEENETDFSKPILWQPNDLPFPSVQIPYSQLSMIPKDCMDPKSQMVEIYQVVRKTQRGSLNVYEYDRALKIELMRDPVQFSFFKMSVFLEEYSKSKMSEALFNVLLHSVKTIYRPIEELNALARDNLKITPRDEICTRSEAVVSALQKQLGLPCAEMETASLLTVFELQLKGKGFDSFPFQPNDFLGLKNLQKLKISDFGNQIQSINTKDLMDLSNLKELTMSQLDLDETPKVFMEGPYQLLHLNLSNNNIFELKRNAFRNVFPKSIATGQDVVLNLSGNTLFSSPRRTVYIHSGAFDNCQSVTHLKMRDFNLNRIDSDVFDPLVNLRSLDLSQNRFRRLPEALQTSSLSNLEELIIGQNSFSKIEPKELKALENLITLDLSSNLLVEFPEFILSLPNLRSLRFCGQNFSLKDYERIGALAKSSNPALKIQFCD